MKVAINRCYGGFRLSNVAYEWLIENKGWKITECHESGRGYKDPEAQIVKSDGMFGSRYYLTRNDDESDVRTNPDIIEAIETLGSEASSDVSNIEIVEIPDDVEWTIEEYDGIEWIAEEHRTWE